MTSLTTIGTRRAAWLAPALAGVLLLGLAGCRLGGHGSDCQVRLIDGIPNARGIRISADGKETIRTGPFGQQTGFVGVAPGRYRVYAAVERRGAADNRLPVREVEIAPHHRYTVLALGVAGGDPPARLKVFDDSTQPQSPLPRGEARVRVAMAATEAPEVDVLVNSIVAFKDLRFCERSEPVMLASLPYEWSVKEAGASTTPLCGPVTITLKGGRSYLIVVMGRASDHTLTLQAFEDK